LDTEKDERFGGVRQGGEVRKRTKKKLEGVSGFREPHAQGVGREKKVVTGKISPLVGITPCRNGSRPGKKD